ncbi:MAG TPA: OmpH family outer membrane protein [Bacteroidaceae bacterium]|jgi:outer membrane protein|nr:OmpH family outer membrane protein [Bacteroidaceae bacterium]MBP8602400.1 OmpH family outer membrane protein [Bacteroidaceae bacterium]HOD68373.1 OmpH family outer membrane protein [Bacteroidaceae bacterium]HPB03994.1 OmpH family outer membrane protein [Bacteroidaceae bacterium]HQL25722.1 OmpH family outer membrane protein [Bacteroidaceae bacterium]
MKKIILAVISAIMVTGFNSCKQSANTQGTQSTQIERSSVAVSGLKIAYIDVDSLLANYEFSKDLSEQMTQKEENYRLLLAEEMNKFQKEVEDFNKKLQNNVFSSPERAQSEQTRLAKKQQSLQEKSDKYSNDLYLENNQNAQKLSETIDNFIREYNKSRGYNLIINKAALMFADDSMDITAEILDGLNAAYTSESTN